MGAEEEVGAEEEESAEVAEGEVELDETDAALFEEVGAPLTKALRLPICVREHGAVNQTSTRGAWARITGEPDDGVRDSKSNRPL